MLLEMLIAASCATGQYNEACRKALEAGSKQSGFYQNVDQAENVMKDQALKQVDNLVGKEPAAVVGAAAKGYKDKGLVYSFKPTDVLSIDKITVQGGKNRNSLNLQWSF